MPALSRVWQQQQFIRRLFFFSQVTLYRAFLWFYRPSSLYRLDFICVKWLLGFYFCCCCSGFGILLKTIFPETVTNENFHSMYFDLKMLVGRSQAKFLMDFLFCPKSSILLFSNGKWEYLPLLSVTVTKWRKYFLQRESYRLSKLQRGWGVIWNISFYEWKSYLFKLLSLIVCCFCGFLTEGNMEQATQNLNFSVWKQS